MSDFLEELEKNEEYSNKIKKKAPIAIGVCVFVIIFGLYSIYDMMSDNSAIHVKCPTGMAPGAPVALEQITRPVDVEQVVRNFVGEVISKMYSPYGPSFASDMEWMMNNSTGGIYRRFKGNYLAAEKIAAEAQGKILKIFTPHNSNDISIRKVMGGFHIAINGYLVYSEDRLSENRLTPTLHLILSTGDSTRKNPSGLKLDDGYYEQIIDEVTGATNKLPL